MSGKAKKTLSRLPSSAAPAMPSASWDLPKPPEEAPQSGGSAEEKQAPADEQQPAVQPEALLAEGAPLEATAASEAEVAVEPRAGGSSGDASVVPQDSTSAPEEQQEPPENNGEPQASTLSAEDDGDANVSALESAHGADGAHSADGGVVAATAVVEESAPQEEAATPEALRTTPSIMITSVSGDKRLSVGAHPVSGALANLSDDEAACILQKYGRAKLEKSRYVKHKKRARVAQELLSTERTYVQSLETMIELYMKPMSSSSRSEKPLVSREKVQMIFSVVEVMTNLNRVLLSDLEQRIGNWHVDMCLGDLFLSMGDYLKVAVQYVNNYETSISTINAELKANAQFQKFYTDTQQDPRSKRMDLKSFLIQPVQRVPRYEMLLKDLIKKTVDGHADLKNLNHAFVKIKGISALIDNRKSDNVRFQEVLRIHALLEPKVAKLVSPTRRFVGEGDITFVPKSRFTTSRGSPGHYFLFNDVLILGKRIKDRKNKEKVSYKPQHVLLIINTECMYVEKQHMVTLRPAGLNDGSLSPAKGKKREDDISFMCDEEGDDLKFCRLYEEAHQALSGTMVQEDGDKYLDLNALRATQDGDAALKSPKPAAAAAAAAAGGEPDESGIPRSQSEKNLSFPDLAHVGRSEDDSDQSAGSARHSPHRKISSEKTEKELDGMAINAKLLTVEALEKMLEEVNSDISEASEDSETRSASERKAAGLRDTIEKLRVEIQGMREALAADDSSTETTKAAKAMNKDEGTKWRKRSQSLNQKSGSAITKKLPIDAAADTTAAEDKKAPPTSIPTQKSGFFTRRGSRKTPSAAGETGEEASKE